MRYNDDATVNASFEVAAGTAAITVAGFAAAVLFPPAEPAGRVLVVAITVGVLSVVFSNWRACLTVAVIAALVFVGFLAHQYGVLTGDATAWSFTALIGFAVLIGRGYRRMMHSPTHDPTPADLLTDDHPRSLLVWPERSPADMSTLDPDTHERNVMSPLLPSGEGRVYHHVVFRRRHRAG